jgi:hypothetical protein
VQVLRRDLNPHSRRFLSCMSKLHIITDCLDIMYRPASDKRPIQLGPIGTAGPYVRSGGKRQDLMSEMLFYIRQEVLERTSRLPSFDTTRSAYKTKKEGGYTDTQTARGSHVSP